MFLQSFYYSFDSRLYTSRLKALLEGTAGLEAHLYQKEKQEDFADLLRVVHN